MIGRTVARAFAFLPRGNAITPASWARRHRTILILVWLHVPALYLVGIVTGNGPIHPLAEVAVIATFAAGAGITRLSRDLRASLATLGLVTSSGVLVHLTGGLIEMHFHFFVAVAVVALYQSWFPFLVAIGFVLLHHGVMGGLDSMSVYNHPAALRNPWKWAALHALFIAGESTAALTAWKLNEVSLQAERSARQELEAAVADLSEAQALTHIGSWDWTVGANRLICSDEMYRICGVSRDAVPTFEHFMSLIVDEEREEVRAIVERASTTADDLEFECHLTRPDGSVRLVQGIGRRAEDASGEIRLVGTLQDVTERKQALHDPLTGLPNRTLFLDRVEHARTQQQRDATTLGVLFVDLDDFKTVNDTKGHLAGDALLREVGTRIAGVLRPGDTLARLGGDEFVILLNGIDGPDDVTAVADRVLDAVAPPRLEEEIGAASSASIGIVVEPAPGSRTPVELLRDADTAMYSAKRTSKGSWVIFDPTMGRDVHMLHTLSRDLRRAIHEEELFLEYQPIVRLSDGTIEGLEAFVRWQHPQRGVVPPLEFIPMADESGQLLEVGRWILARACGDAARWRDPSTAERPLTVSVNVAPRQLRDPRFLEVLTRALSGSELPPERLILDVTEASLSGHASIDRRLDEIADLGVRLAVDDFGTGSSSLADLHRLPLDRLKIDRSFVGALTDGAPASAVARAVVELGRALALDVVAEGVEREDQAETLREIGCGLAQGYLFSRPVDARAIDAVLDAPAGAQDAGRATA